MRLEGGIRTQKELPDHQAEGKAYVTGRTKVLNREIRQSSQDQPGNGDVAGAGLQKTRTQPSASLPFSSLLCRPLRNDNMAGSQRKQLARLEN